MGKVADSIMDICTTVLNDFGYQLEDIHLIDYDKWKSIENDMTFELIKNKLDLSYTSDFSDKYGIKLAGNRGGIIHDIRYFYKSQHASGWKKLDQLKTSDVESASRFFKEDKYGYPVSITKEEFLRLVANNKSRSDYVGIGSRSSIIETTVTVYIDYKGNLMFDQFTMTWD